MLARVIAIGDLTIVDARGRLHHFGDGSGGPVRARILDRATERALALNPDLSGPEAYVDGRLVMEEGSLYDLIALVMSNAARTPLPTWTGPIARFRRILRHVQQFNPVRRSGHNARHHYDIDPRIFDLFLDRDAQYSCAYFTPGLDGLDAAQRAKQLHIAAKLRLAPGHRVLDIGSGWGGLALFMARETGTAVTGITLSREQLARAEARARAEGLEQLVRFRLKDFREVEGQFDRIVSVGMFEHVGVDHYRTFFTCLARLLADDGVALVHTIGRADEPAATNRFIQRHIFPGGALPAMSEIVRAIEPSGLVVTDIEVLRLHYAETLRLWRERFLGRRDEAVAISGERFARMWEAYLAGSEAAFRYQNLVVFQVQLTKSVETLPITRDYMWREERRLAAAGRLGAEVARAPHVREAAARRRRS